MQSSGTRSADAPAKINLGLRIMRKRDDGFHDLETGMVAIELADRITVGRARELSMSCSDLTLSTGEDNLCIKAAKALQEAFVCGSGAHIHLEKHIPHGAGLGGGSSDAATTLRLLSDLWSLDAPTETIHALSKSIGSDVAFFVNANPAIASGRGSDLTPIDLPVSVSSLWIGLVQPDIRISTAEAYHQCIPHDDHAIALNAIVCGTEPENWRQELINDFEVSVFANHPILSDLKNALYAGGAIYAAMSGSGSSVFGLFRTRQAAVKALGKARMRSWCGQMLTD